MGTPLAPLALGLVFLAVGIAGLIDTTTELDVEPETSWSVALVTLGIAGLVSAARTIWTDRLRSSTEGFAGDGAGTEGLSGDDGATEELSGDEVATDRVPPAEARERGDR